MSYKVFLHPKAADFLKKAEANLRSRIKDALKGLENSPEAKGQRLRDSRFLRTRIGDYRAIYMIDEEERRVTVLFIGHRKEVYDDFSRLL